MAHLFDRLTIRDLQFNNRVFVSPMCEYSCVDGYTNDWHFVHLGSRAVGGAGLVLTEAAAIGWSNVMAPSAIPFAENYPMPKALKLDQIQEIVAAFAAAARRACDAAFRVIEIRAAHGYLIHEFLSPLSNHRADAYGGSFDNRTRLIREVVTAVRSSWPKGAPLFVRISATDWVEGGWDLEQSIELARMLKSLGVDLIDCSSGGTVPHAIIPAAPGYQTPFAQ
jgi:2,4-dienoyl-CoA reductase-like NADH-dependent reductase (Old Yellow Enzyme family)